MINDPNNRQLVLSVKINKIVYKRGQVYCKNKCRNVYIFIKNIVNVKRVIVFYNLWKYVLQ